MSQIKFNCTQCGQRLECEDELSGRQISCPKCKGSVLVPAADGTPKPVLQKSGMTFVPESWTKPSPAKPKPPAST